ncbi:MAG: hypothetical protein BWX60_00529 [Candidatus Marinimicrobia bacterium ADurb.Bin030]|nr:MAG: hypothetical protein BWX60_00529 [Candidatus Marinimicrobia bacterium ADurb.Bin030]
MRFDAESFWRFRFSNSYNFFTALDRFQKIEYFVLLIITQHEKDTGNIKQFGGGNLGVATDNGNFAIGRNASRGSDGAAGLGFGGLRHGARVNNSQIGRFIGIYYVQITIGKFGLNGICFRLIQATAKRSKCDRCNQVCLISIIL